MLTPTKLQASTEKPRFVDEAYTGVTKEKGIQGIGEG